MKLINALAQAISYELNLKSDTDNDMYYDVLCSDVHGYDFDCKVNISWRYTPETRWQPSEVNPIIHSVSVETVWNFEGERVKLDIDEKLLAKTINI